VEGLERSMQTDYIMKVHNIDVQYNCRLRKHACSWCWWPTVYI